MPAAPQVIVAGHICLDIIPTFPARGENLADLLVPGTLVEIGNAVVSTGGAVSNTGLGLHRLGIPTRLMGKIGDDLFGEAIASVLRRYDARLADGLLVAPGEQSSYTVVVNPPNIDRVFLHCPGANNTFDADDVPYDVLAPARVFHFGYPPVMECFYRDEGAALGAMFAQVAQRGLVTSLDMAYPDPASAAGQVDWRAILARTLPHVDLFLPSYEELLFMLDRPRFEHLSTNGELLSACDGVLLHELAEDLLDLGAGVVGIKLGDDGLYVRTPADANRLHRLASIDAGIPDAWRGQELLSPCFRVDVVGTTGCGDCTIAGFLAGLLHGADLPDTLTAAVAVGACTAEQPDAFSGVQPWDAVQARIAAGWARHPLPDWPGWEADAGGTLLRGAGK